MKLLKHIKTLVNKITKRDKWKLYLYLNGQCVAKLYIDENFAPMDNFYVIKIKGMKQLVGTNRAIQMVVQPYKYKYTDEKKKEAHIEVISFEGVDTK